MITISKNKENPERWDVSISCWATYTYLTLLLHSAFRIKISWVPTCSYVTAGLLLAGFYIISRLGLDAINEQIECDEDPWEMYGDERQAALEENTPEEYVRVFLKASFEEYMFRGVMFSVFGIFFATFVFMILHSTKQPRFRATYVWLALILQLEYWLCGGLLIPMIHHTIHNLYATYQWRQAWAEKEVC